MSYLKIQMFQWTSTSWMRRLNIFCDLTAHSCDERDCHTATQNIILVPQVGSKTTFSSCRWLFDIPTWLLDIFPGSLSGLHDRSLNRHVKKSIIKVTAMKRLSNMQLLLTNLTSCHNAMCVSISLDAEVSIYIVAELLHHLCNSLMKTEREKGIQAFIDFMIYLYITFN